MNKQKIPAIYCRQWLADWDKYDFLEANARRKPPAELLIFSMSAKQLRKLSGVYVRKHDGTDTTGIQRVHEKDRSQKIAEYVHTGYPYGDLSAKQKQDPDNDSLRKPGWLPTAIVINFLRVDDERRGKFVHPDDAIKVEEVSGAVNVVLPAEAADNTWQSQGLSPIEIIDGQHRLFAFDEASQLPDDFELPVVAFQGLDIGWQAYLFWSINVSPKKINPSHAYDLFPLLRTQDWLEKVSSVHVYREARAQELTDLLFRHPDSPWKGRINMLGEKKSGWVSQAGWVQAIYNSFLSPGSSRSRKGLFAANLSTTEGPLDWCRPQQAAFLIFIWQRLREAVRNKVNGWPEKLRSLQQENMNFEDGHDLAFLGSKTLLNQEQGVRGFSLVFNDVLFRGAAHLKLNDWQVDDIDIGETRSGDIDRCLVELNKQSFANEISDAVMSLADFDWRSSDAPDLTEKEELKKSGFRGTGGYGRVRQELLILLAMKDSALGTIAGQIIASEAT